MVSVAHIEPSTREAPPREIRGSQNLAFFRLPRVSPKIPLQELLGEREQHERFVSCIDREIIEPWIQACLVSSRCIPIHGAPDWMKSLRVIAVNEHVAISWKHIYKHNGNAAALAAALSVATNFSGVLHLDIRSEESSVMFLPVPSPAQFNFLRRDDSSSLRTIGLYGEATPLDLLHNLINGRRVVALHHPAAADNLVDFHGIKAVGQICAALHDYYHWRQLAYYDVRSISQGAKLLLRVSNVLHREEEEILESEEPHQKSRLSAVRELIRICNEKIIIPFCDGDVTSRYAVAQDDGTRTDQVVGRIFDDFRAHTYTTIFHPTHFRLQREVDRILPKLRVALMRGRDASHDRLIKA